MAGFQFDAHQCVVGGRPRIDERAERARSFDVAGDGLHRQAEMFCEKPIADATNPCPHAGFAGRVHRQIAFGVHAHRTPREVGRPDPDHLIVDNHHLRVDERRARLAARDAAG